MNILAIETSCDDTAVAILKISGQKNPNFKILSNIISSQVKIHAKYGGVYPMLAKREHQKNLPIVLKKALKKANFSISNLKFLMSKIDAIAVTAGPGLEPCLWTGINFAKDLAEKLKIPLVSVNHIEAHILANFINLKSYTLNLKSLFPAICLVVSGGHTQLILTNGIGRYKIIGETRDDAAGECFDKCARILGLGYPGGPIIAIKAAELKSEILNLKSKIKLPRPMITHKNYDFSFSGLKTAVLYEVKDERFKIKDKEYVKAMCAEIQQAIIDVLLKKTIKAAKDFKAKTIILGGGVTANEELKKQFKFAISKQKLEINFLVPPKNLSTDNAVMAAITAFFHFKEKTKIYGKIEAEANLRIDS